MIYGFSHINKHQQIYEQKSELLIRCAKRYISIPIQSRPLNECPSMQQKGWPPTPHFPCKRTPSSPILPLTCVKAVVHLRPFKPPLFNRSTSHTRLSLHPITTTRKRDKARAKKQSLLTLIARGPPDDISCSVCRGAGLFEPRAGFPIILKNLVLAATGSGSWGSRTWFLFGIIAWLYFPRREFIPGLYSEYVSAVKESNRMLVRRLKKCLILGSSFIVLIWVVGTCSIHLSFLRAMYQAACLRFGAGEAYLFVKTIYFCL